jgi:hypothetical protein
MIRPPRRLDIVFDKLKQDINTYTSGYMTDGIQDAMELILEQAALLVSWRNDGYPDTDAFAEIDQLSVKYGIHWHLIRREGGSDVWQYAPFTHSEQVSVMFAKRQELNQTSDNFHYAVATRRRARELGVSEK